MKRNSIKGCLVLYSQSMFFITFFSADIDSNRGRFVTADPERELLPVSLFLAFNAFNFVFENTSYSTIFVRLTENGQNHNDRHPKMPALNFRWSPNPAKNRARTWSKRRRSLMMVVSRVFIWFSSSNIVDNIKGNEEETRGRRRRRTGEIVRRS